MIIDDVSMAKHKMGGLLTLIRESISFALEDLQGSANVIQKKMLLTAMNGVERLIRLTDNYFLIQKLDEGIIVLDSEVGDLNKAADAACSKFSAAAEQKGTGIILKLDDKLPKTKFDRELIGTVLENVIRNAVDFTEKGTIVIATSFDDESVRVSVSDTGCGMAEQEVSKLFHRFEKLSNNRAKNRSSDGLGLSVSKEIMDRHDGRIWLESTSDKGSTFVISLPIRSD
ncbi:MAG: HAMP domain-containing sensor histidine kinase [bacterium]